MAALLVAGVLAASLPAAADPDDRLEQIEKKKQSVQEKRAAAEERAASLSQRIARLDEIRARVDARVDKLNRHISRLDARIEGARERLEEEQIRLALETDELQSILARLDRRSGLFERRARAAYMAGPTAYLDSLLSSESFTDLIDRSSYYEAALDADSQLISEIEVLRGESETRRDTILERQHEIATTKHRLEADRSEIARARAAETKILQRQEAVLASKRDLLRKVNRDKRYYQALEGQLEQDSAELTALIQAQAAAAASGTSVPVPTFSGAPGGGQLAWPAAGSVTSGYGYRTHPIFGDQRMHSGIDIAAPYGAPVYSADNGTVSFVGAMSGYGNVVVVDHGGGLSTTYNHLSGFSVGSGQSVGRGQQIGSVGCTGYCTGPHLHFEVRINGTPVDPMPYLQ